MILRYEHEKAYNVVALDEDDIDAISVQYGKIYCRLTNSI